MADVDDSENSRQPARFLVEHVSLLPRGQVLDIAMGNGRNAVYLAARGFEVEGVDISEVAIQNACQLAKEQNTIIKARVADLENDYRIFPDSYDVIICFNYLQRSLIPQIKSGLRPGGMVVYETFIIDQVKFGKPRNPDFLLEYNELLKMFCDFRCLRYREGIFENRKAIASLLASKVA
jgi:tellurite methyltransferase